MVYSAQRRRFPPRRLHHSPVRPPLHRAPEPDGLLALETSRRPLLHVVGHHARCQLQHAQACEPARSGQSFSQHLNNCAKSCLARGATCPPTLCSTFASIYTTAARVQRHFSSWWTPAVLSALLSCSRQHPERTARSAKWRGWTPRWRRRWSLPPRQSMPSMAAFTEARLTASAPRAALHRWGSRPAVSAWRATPSTQTSVSSSDCGARMRRWRNRRSLVRVVGARIRSRSTSRASAPRVSIAVPAQRGRLWCVLRRQRRGGRRGSSRRRRRVGALAPCTSR